MSYDMYRTTTRSLCFLSIIVSLAHCDFSYVYEFENAVGGPGTSRSPWRSGASNVSALHLYEGDAVELSICLQQTAEISIAGIEYSNDGPSDLIEFTSNGVKVGEFQTEASTGGWGTHWDIKKWSGSIGEQFNLLPGTHVFRINVTSTDCHGTEIDRVNFTSPLEIATGLICGSNLILSENPPPCAVDFDKSLTEAETSTTTSSTTSTTSTSSSSTTTTTTTPATSTSTTTSPSAATTTKPSTLKETAPINVEQHSFESSCLDNSNVVVKFHSNNLIGTKIVVVSTSNTRGHLNDAFIVKSELFCEDTFVWQIGEVNRNDSDLGPMWTEDHIDFNVNSPDPNLGVQKPFPGEIDPKQSNEIVIRYVIPKHITLKGGKVRFIVGLVDVSNNVTVGAQFYRRHKKDPSNIKYNTFTKKQQVKKWVVPIRGISPSLENQLVLYFDEKSPHYIKFDFLRMEYLPPSIRTKPVRLSQKGLWKIRGRQYHEGGKGAQKNIKINGMEVVIDDKKMSGLYESVYIIRKPNKEILGVFENGEIYPTHESKLSKKSRNNAHFKPQDVTGITFEAKAISQVIINTDSQTLTIIYNDSTKVKLSFKYTKIKSTFTIEDINMKPETMSFFSTYVSPTSAAINELIVDNERRMNIMDLNIHGITGNSFKFENNALKPLFNDKYEIMFP